MKVSTILPNYNDSKILIKYVEEIKNILNKTKYKYEFIIVDDGSDTFNKKLVKSFSNKKKFIKFIDLEINHGQQSALMEGMKVSSGDIVVTLDSDRQYEPKVVLQIIKSMNNKYDFFSGIRFRRQDSLIGLLTSYIGNFFLKTFLNIELKDFGSVKGFSKNLTKKIIKNDNVPFNVYSQGYFLSDKIKEEKIVHLKRKEGISKWSLVDRLKLYFNIFMKHAKGFGITFKAGFWLCIISIFGIIFMSSYKYFFNHAASYFIIFTIFFLLILLGTQFVIFSFILSFLKEIILKINQIK